MKKRPISIFIITVFILFCSFPVPAAEPQFSADFISTVDALGNQVSGRIFVKGEKVRQDFIKDGRLSYSTIRLPAQNILITLWPEKQYEEDILPADPFQPPADEHSEQSLGMETVNGYECEVTRYTYTKKVLGVWTRWYSPRLNYSIKLVKKSATGKTQMSFELTNIKEEQLDDKLFEIAPGYKRFPLYGDIPVSCYTAKCEHSPLSYLYLIADNYERKATKKWPLLIYLHGRGGLGDNIELMRKDTRIALILKHIQDKCIIIAPQCPTRAGYWHVDDLDNMLSEIIKKFAVDTKRIYLTGESMGGYGAWFWAIERPERFAAVVPLCGGGDPARAYLIKKIPIWAFHGAIDLSVPVVETRNMVDALRACGGNVKYTEYPDKSHFIWEETYGNPELWEWVLKQKKR